MNIKPPLRSETLNDIMTNDIDDNMKFFPEKCLAEFGGIEKKM